MRIRPTAAGLETPSLIQALVHELRTIWVKITKNFVSDFEKLISNQLVSESYLRYSHTQ